MVVKIGGLVFASLQLVRQRQDISVLVIHPLVRWLSVTWTPPKNFGYCETVCETSFRVYKFTVKVPNFKSSLTQHGIRFRNRNGVADEFLPYGCPQHSQPGSSPNSSLQKIPKQALKLDEQLPKCQLQASKQVRTNQ